MSVTEITTLLIALAALATSIVTAIEMVRQRENSVRPVLVMLEKLTDNAHPEAGRSLYLVNMGQALALQATVVRYHAAPDLGLPPALAPTQTEIFPGRRARLATDLPHSVLARLQLTVAYQDLNRLLNSGRVLKKVEMQGGES